MNSRWTPCAAKLPAIFGLAFQACSEGVRALNEVMNSSRVTFGLLVLTCVLFAGCASAEKQPPVIHLLSQNKETTFYTFLKDIGKYNFFDMAYPFVSDSHNFGNLQGQLSDSYYISRFQVMIRH